MGPVLVGGAFDPLHPGHLAYFRRVRQMFPGHKVICAIAPDAEVAEKHPPLLTASQRAMLVEPHVDGTIVSDEGVATLIRELKPLAYVKGQEWEGRLPLSQQLACAQADCPIVYLNCRQDSSSDILQRYRIKADTAALDQLEEFVQLQERVTAGTCWHGAATYTLDQRRPIEEPHAALVAKLFKGCSVVDAGCGPGAFVWLLQEQGMDAIGFDWSGDYHAPVCYGDLTGDQVPPFKADLVICREVLEHLSVPQLMAAVRNLVKISRKFIYITTRYADGHLLHATTDQTTDPTHISCLTKPLLQALFILWGCRSRPDLETQLDWQHKRRCLVFEV